MKKSTSLMVAALCCALTLSVAPAQNLSGPAVQPAPAATNSWVDSISPNGTPHLSQPSFSNLGGQASFGQLPNVNANSVLCNNTGSPATPIQCTQAQITEMINLATASLSGALPAWPNDPTKYFAGDGSYRTLNFAALGATIGGLPSKSTPVGSDIFVIGDSAAGGAQKQTTLTQAIAAVGSGVTSVNQQVGALVQNPMPQGRLTFTSGAGVMNASVTAGTSVIYTSYAGKNIPIFNGTALAPYQICAANTVGPCELPITLGSNWLANTIYRQFVGLNAGVPTLCSGPAWTNSGAGTSTVGTGAGTSQIVQLDGVQTNAVSITCRNSNTTTFTCAVNQCTAVGDILIGSSAGTVNYIFGASAAGGSAANFGLCNFYNRVRVSTVVQDSNGTWTGTGTNLIQPLDATGAGSGLNNRITFLQCTTDEPSLADMRLSLQNPNNAADAGGGAIGVNNTALQCVGGAWSELNITGVAQVTAFCQSSALGLNFFQALQVTGVGTMTFFGVSPGGNGGLIGELKL